jgi:hypothetical protein
MRALTIVHHLEHYTFQTKLHSGLYIISRARSTFNEIIYLHTEGNRPLGRPSRRWVDNIRMDLLELGC